MTKFQLINYLLLSNIILFCSTEIYSQKTSDIGTAFHRVTFYKKDTMYQFYVAIPGKSDHIDDDGKYFSYVKDTILTTVGGYHGQVLHGLFVKYYPSMNLAEMETFSMGRKNGEAKTWFIDGNLKSITYWKLGKKDGAFKMYDSTGDLIKFGQYKANKLNGEISERSSDGTTVSYKYINGIRKSLKMRKRINLKSILVLKKNKSVKGNALVITVIIALIVGLLSSLLILQGYLYRSSQIKFISEERTSRNLESGIAIFLSDTVLRNKEIVSYNGIFGNDEDSLVIKKMPWGLYTVGIAKASTNRHSIWPETKEVVANTNRLNDDSFILIKDYPDPFFPDSGQLSDLEFDKKNKEILKPMISQDSLLRIKIHNMIQLNGIIGSPRNKHIIGIVTINGNEYLAKPGQTIENILIKRIDKKNMLIIFEKMEFVINKMK